MPKITVKIDQREGFVATFSRGDTHIATLHQVRREGAWMAPFFTFPPAPLADDITELVNQEGDLIDGRIRLYASE